MSVTINVVAAETNKLINPPKTKGLNIKKIILLGLVVIIVVATVPLPFKPSIWSYIHRKKLDHNLSTFTAPVFLPAKDENRHVTFETFLGWKNSYLIRGYENESSHTGGIFYYQLAKTGSFVATTEGPSDDDMRIYKDTLLKDCPKHPTDIYLCETGDPKRYIAKLDVGDFILATEVTNKVFNGAKLEYPKYTTPHDYLPPKIEDIQNVATTFIQAKPIPLAEARKCFSPEF
ncbi:MAG: hypothetical protein M3Q79_03330 [bacterium]|nr:hypothetical protein [bacterium]